MISHNKPSVGREEVEAVSKALLSGWVAQGKEVKAFEDGMSRYVYGKLGHAVAVSSGTAALYTALLALGAKENDEVIVPSYVCSAVLNAVFLAKAKPILVDINADDLNISFEQTKKRIGTKTKAIIVSHTFGMPAPVDIFLSLGVPVIEDCAQALGAKFKGRQVGTFGTIATFSFYATKMMTTGYGGMVCSQDKAIIGKIRDYREFDCRKTYKPRFNFQMSDFQAAMGRVQLRRLPSFLKKRKEIAGKYYRVLLEDKAWPPRIVRNKSPNFFRFLVRGDHTSRLQQFMEKRGVKTIVPTQTHELLHRYLKKNPANFPVSESIAKTTLSLPIYPSLTDKEIEKICSALDNFQHGRY